MPGSIAPPWGTPLHDSGSVDCPLRFPGQYHDPETGLHYNHHRYYDPETGAYTGPDPLGLAASPNPHTYVHNPLTWADPRGLALCPANVALGTRTEGDLRNFADSRGFTHYLDDWQTWEAEVRAAAHNPNVLLHVVMDGFRGGATPEELFMSAYRRGMLDYGWRATGREICHVGKAIRVGDRAWDNITFYMNGMPIHVAEPDSFPVPGR